MMMTGRSRSRNSTQSRFITTGIIVVLVVLIGTLVGPYVRDLIVAARVSSDVYGKYALTPKSVLIERLDRAETELNRIRYQSVLYQSLEKQNAALRAEAKFISTSTYGTARVVAVPPTTHYDTIVIAAGSGDGVLVGDQVSVEGLAVGTITSVSQGSSVAELYTSAGREVDVELGKPSGTLVMRGLGGGAGETTVPDSVVVAPGDAVTDTKTGVVLGTVSSIAKREIDTSATVRITLPLSLSSLSLVSLQH